MGIISTLIGLLFAYVEVYVKLRTRFIEGLFKLVSMLPVVSPPFVLSLSMIMLFLSIIGIFYTSAFYQSLINSCGVFLFSLYLIYDTQLVIGKNQKLISTDNYIVGALMIYIDIVSIFIKILMLFGKKKK